MPAKNKAPKDRPYEGKQQTGHCMKCKDKRKIMGAVITTMKNGRTALKGTCQKCGTGMFKIGSFD